MSMAKTKARQRVVSKERWWLAPDDEIGPFVRARANDLWDMDAPRRKEIEKNLRRWGVELEGLYLVRQSRVRDALRVNLTKSLTETIVAKIGKNRPRPQVLTDGGSDAARRAGKELQRFLDGVYNAANVYALTPSFFRSTMLFGHGAMRVTSKIVEGEGKLCLENVLPIELLVDEQAASEGNPRELIRVSIADKDDLIAGYPEFEDEIEQDKGQGLGVDASGPYRKDAEGGQVRACLVIEAWRLPSVKRDGSLIPGKYVKAVGDQPLEIEPWLDHSFPFVMQPWCEAVRGVWGDSAVAEIRGMEKEMNRLLQRNQESMQRLGNPFVLVHDQSEVKVERWNNEPATVVKWAGEKPPQVMAAQAVHPTMYEAPWLFKREAANLLGTNELQMSATKPAGIESGRALEQLSEEHSVRFDTVSKAFENVIARDLAQAFLAEARRLDTRMRDLGIKGGFTLRAKVGKQQLKINWKRAAMTPEDFFLGVFPVSVLPHTPSGRTTEVERWQANEWVDKQTAMRLLEFPDLESAGSLETADADLLEWQIEQILDHGEAVVVDSRQNLDRAMQMATYHKLKATREGASPERLDLLELFLRSIEDQIQARVAAETPPADPTTVTDALMAPPAGGAPLLPAPIEDPMATTGLPPLM